jgi:hypothetical protein
MAFFASFSITQYGMDLKEILDGSVNTNDDKIPSLF